ncbi:MAG: ATP-binding protein, partial [Methanoculleus sp.]|nr:ATP-binding protein [Methanoculleus sp.]
MSRDFFDLASLQEGFDVELKAARGRGGKGELPDSFWETYSAMANTEGGYVILGAEETRNGVVLHDLPDHQKIIQ